MPNVAIPFDASYVETPASELAERIAERRAQLGRRLVILGHHYQVEEVVRFADFIGDSFKLAKDGASRPDAD